MNIKSKKILSFFLALVMAFGSVALVEAVAVTPTTITAFAASKKVAISKKTLRISKGAKYTLKVKNNKKKIKWTTSKKSVATVSSKGKVTAKKKGTATITAKIGSKKYTCKVTVESPSISSKNKTIGYGSSVTLKMKNTKNKATWSSSDKSVATVSSKGVVTGKKVGTAVISAKCGYKTYKCTVTVVSSIAASKITVSYIECADNSVVALFTNNNSEAVEINANLAFFNNGAPVDVSYGSSYCVGVGKTCAMVFYPTKTDVVYNSYKCELTADKSVYVDFSSNVVISPATKSGDAFVNTFTNTASVKLDSVEYIVVYRNAAGVAVTTTDRYLYDEFEAPGSVAYVSNNPYNDDNTIVSAEYYIHHAYNYDIVSF